MTSRERIESALNHKQPDRTPIFEYVLQSPRADDLLGRPYAADTTHWDAVVAEKGWDGAVRQSAVDQLELALRMGYDMLYVVPNPTIAAIAPEDRSPAPEMPEDPVERVRLRNEQAFRSAAAPEDSLLVYAYLKQEMRRRVVDLPILAPAYVHGVWTDVDLMQTILLAPEVAHHHFAIATLRALKVIDRYLDLGIDQFGIGGDFAGTRPLISPEVYREFIVPEVRKLSRRIHAAKRCAFNASDGHLWPVIEDFLFGCEVDGYLEIDMHAGMEMSKLKQICRGRITLYGNLDCGNTLSFGSRDDVRKHTRACLESGLGDGGHILCASNAITASVPLDNYLTVIDTYRDMFGMTKFRLA